MEQAVQILLHGSQGFTYLTVNIIRADDLATQGARASAPKLLTEFSQNILASMTKYQISTESYLKSISLRVELLPNPFIIIQASVFSLESANDKASMVWKTIASNQI